MIVDSKNKIPIVFITDNNFAVPTGVAMFSLIKNKNIDTHYDIYIFCINVEDKYLKIFNQMSDNKVSISILNLENKYTLLNTKHPHVSKAALFKFDIPNLLINYDKVLYLDGDILVQMDLSTLYNLDIDNYFVSAVRDMAAEKSLKQHGDIIVGVDRYFNSGVMLLNLKKMRLNSITSKLLEVKKEKKEFVTMDQDVFNYVFKENVLWFGPEYNNMIFNVIKAGFTLSDFNIFYDTNYKSFSAVIENSYIIHLTNNKKPWLDKFSFMNREWFKYFRQTGLAEIEKISENEVTVFESEVNSLQNETQFELTKSQMTSITGELDSMKNSLDTTKSQLDTTKSQLDTTKSQLDTTKSQLDTTKSQLDTTKSQLDTTKSQLDLRVSELSVIYLSRSWRMITLLNKVFSFLFPKKSKRRRVARFFWIIFKKARKIIVRIIIKAEVVVHYITIMLFGNWLRPKRLDVIQVYNYFLGREPESRLAIQYHLQRQTVEELIASIMVSEEYKHRVKQGVYPQFSQLSLRSRFNCPLPFLIFLYRNRTLNCFAITFSELTPRARIIYNNLQKRADSVLSTSIITPFLDLSEEGTVLKGKEKRRIVIDMQGLQTPFSSSRGVGRYTREMVKAFLRVASRKYDIFLLLNSAFEDNMEMIYSEFLGLVPRENIKCWQQYLHPVSGISNNLWGRKASELVREWYISQLSPDIIWSTNLQEGWNDDGVTSVKLLYDGAIYCTTLHDVIPLIYPETHLTSKIKPWYMEKIEQTKHSDIILSVSEYSKEKIIKLAQVDSKRVYVAGNSYNSVIFNTISDPNFISDELKPLTSIEYILYAGGADAHKNIKRLVSAYAQLGTDLQNRFKLVLVGKEVKAREFELSRHGSDLGVEPSQLIFTGYVSDHDLSCLYKNARIFVFPSYSEGFGIPPLEAMACGCPVIAANAASLPEVIAFPEALFDPFDEKDIALKMRLGLVNERYRQKLIANGVSRAGFFSWEASAKIILDLFEKIIEENLEKLNLNNYDNDYFNNITKKLTKNIISLPKPSKDNLLLLSQSISDNIVGINRQHRVYIDLSCLVHFDHATGIQRVTRAIMSELETMKMEDLEFIGVFSYPGCKYFYKAQLFEGKYFTPDRKELNQNIVDFSDGDVLLFLDLHPGNLISKNFEIASLRHRGVKVYSVVYDLLPVLFPTYFVKELGEEFDLWLRAVVNLDGAFCISKDVANKLREWVDGNKIIPDESFEIRHFHLGADIDHSSPSKGLPKDAEQLLKLFSDRSSFLMVGTVEPRKGHAFVLDAFEQLWKSESQDVLIIVGREGWCNEATANRIRTHKEYNKHLFWLEGISDEYLEKIYNVSTCLIAASEGEGFGLPLIEAAQHKLPIIARDIPVFREVASEYAYYFNGDKPEDLSEAIVNWLKLNTNGKAPQSVDMPWLTWRESTQQLLRLFFPKINFNFKEIQKTNSSDKDGVTNRFYLKKLKRKIIDILHHYKPRRFIKKIFYRLGLN